MVCCPRCKGQLEVQVPCAKVNGLEICLYCSRCRVVYPVVNGMPAFISREEQVSYGRRMDLMRSLYAAFYTPLTDAIFNLFCGGAERARLEVIERLDIPAGARILETGIGTGDNLPYLHRLNGGCTYYGIDNQQRMLKKCDARAGRRNITAELLLADAERLPFRDHLFDVVFHLGAINIFPDKQRAIREMIRVAKPGSRIVIADETEKAGKLFEIFIGKQPEIIPPVELIPADSTEIRYAEIWKGYGYLIEFRTPAA